MHPLRRTFAQAGALGLVAVLSMTSAHAAPPARAADVAGRYAVLRDAKDTGCMVTLSPNPRGKGFRAQLAPACRDQGIVVFDPVGWWLERGKLHLQARKGHNIALGYTDGVWSREGEKPLGLKKI
jgi:hypothetical protein